MKSRGAQWEGSGGCRRRRESAEPVGIRSRQPGGLGLLVKVNTHRIKDVMESVLVDCRLCVLGDRDLCIEQGGLGRGRVFVFVFNYLKNF